MDDPNSGFSLKLVSNSVQIYISKQVLAGQGGSAKQVG